MAEETFLDDLLGKLGVSNQVLLPIVGQRVVADQRIEARDLWTMLSVRGESKAAEMAAQIGDVVSAEGAERLLGLSKSGVHKAKAENRLLGFRLPSGAGDLFSVFQIEKGGVRAWIPSLFKLVGNGLPAVHFLVVPCKSLGGASYFDLLARGDESKVIAAMLVRAERMGNAAATPSQDAVVVAAGTVA